MTRLECTVASCVHNSEKCCCKQGILVEGVNARESCDTCCGSFEENRGGLFKNLFKTPETRLQVDCDVLNCLYNDDHQCRAERISILGDGARAVGPVSYTHLDVYKRQDPGSGQKKQAQGIRKA